MKKLILVIFLLVSGTLVGHSDSGGVQLSELCETDLFSDQELTARVDQFSIWDTAFLEVRCKVLVRDSYVINTQWMDETGKLQAEREHKASLGFPRPYSAVFKFRQMPVGSLKKMSAGEDFEAYQYGQWSVLTFINGEEIGRTYFTITE